MHLTHKIMAFTTTSFFLSSLFSCTNIFIHNHDDIAAIARSMDFEFDVGDTFGVGHAGEQNTSNINLPQKTPVNAATWTTRYGFMGQTAFNGRNVIDGINTKGLYAGILYLSDVTKYPVYDEHNAKPEMGISDVENYLLATAASVDDAIKQLNKVQVVANTYPLNVKELKVFPAHLLLRDKGGDSAVVEWIGGQTKIYHPAGDVLTNAPQYSWQVQHAKKYDSVFTGNNQQKVDGIIMKGSGLQGIPGDFTSPSRFTRETQLVRLSPKPQNEEEALSIAKTDIQSAVTPIGSNPSPTLWTSLIDLKDGIYWFHPLYQLVSANDKQVTLRLATGRKDNHQYQLTDILNRQSLPKGFISAQITSKGKITNLDKVYQYFYMTNTPAHIKVRLI